MSVVGFHVAPRRARSSIRTKGLVPGPSGSVYIHTTVEAARAMAQQRAHSNYSRYAEGIDIWRVDLDDLVASVPRRTPVRTGPIAAHRLTLVEALEHPVPPDLATVLHALAHASDWNRARAALRGLLRMTEAAGGTGSLENAGPRAFTPAVPFPPSGSKGRDGAA
jgi:hypothetical protein